MKVSLEDILCDSNINRAIDYISKKKDTAGDDGVRPSDLEQYWITNKLKISNSVLQGNYEQ